ncbi:hypothetical protein, partial [Escherichia coli]
SLKTSIKTITYLSDIGCLEIQGASLSENSIRACITLGFLNLEVMVSLLFYINLTQQMLLKSRFLEFTNISAQLANIKEQRLSKVTFMIGRILILKAKIQKSGYKKLLLRHPDALPPFCILYVGCFLT